MDVITELGEHVIGIPIALLLSWMLVWLKGIREDIRDLYKKYNTLSNDLIHQLNEVSERVSRIEGYCRARSQTCATGTPQKGGA